MGSSFQERRAAVRRRRPGNTAPEYGELREADRRQFPPQSASGDDDDVTKQLRDAIDAYKRKNHLARISLAELMAVLNHLG
jgi:hypothetical protein